MSKSLMTARSNVVALPPLNAHPDYELGYDAAMRGEPLHHVQNPSSIFRAGWKAFWVARGMAVHAGPRDRAEVVNVAPLPKRPAEDLTPEGIQLVIPGAERRMPAGRKQWELF